MITKLAAEAAEKIRSLTYSGLIDLERCVGVAQKSVFLGLLHLVNKQDRRIADLESRIASLERAKRH
jgi:hypothetical protein